MNFLIKFGIIYKYRIIIFKTYIKMHRKLNNFNIIHYMIYTTVKIIHYIYYIPAKIIKWNQIIQPLKTKKDNVKT